jgi:hypothetical protein
MLETMASDTLYIDVLKKLQSRTHLDSDEAEQLLQAIFDQQAQRDPDGGIAECFGGQGENRLKRSSDLRVA